MHPRVKSFVRLLEREGWAALQAENGRKALENPQDAHSVGRLARPPHARARRILRAREMRAHANGRDIPVVVLTSLD